MSAFSQVVNGQDSSLLGYSLEQEDELQVINDPNLVEPASKEIKQHKKQNKVRELNEQIALGSFSGSGGDSQLQVDIDSYFVGSGDVLEISVFQVEELNRKVRVAGSGKIMIPLLGEVQVDGLTTTEVEVLLTEKLEQDYLHDPQVSVFIDEYKSHQIAVLGSVKNPNIYNIRQPRTVLEMLAQAGGLNDKAGTYIQVQRTVVNSETREKKKEKLIIDLSALLAGVSQEINVVMKGGDSIVVPEAGSIFIEGAVGKPGAYDMRGETNVLKALSMAGGILYETSKQHIEIYRETIQGENQVFQVSYDDIRENPELDVLLQEGDIIVVHHSSFKRGMASFWRGFTGLFNVGVGL